MGSWVRLPASSTRCPLSLASVSGVSTCFAAQNSLYTQGANACKIVRLFSADIAIVSSSHSFVADQTQDNRRLYDFALGSGTQIASFHILASISGHRNFCLAVTTKADKADEEMGVHHFYHLSHWNTVQKSIPRALNIPLVIYGNRRLYDFASGSGTQIASFHILASISGCTLR
ncbi:hypothetical protein T02_8578, partial [Trichinella nativa]